MRCLTLVFIFACPAVLLAQGTQADYDRAARLGELAQGKVSNLNWDGVWINGSKQLAFRRESPDGKRVVVQVDTVTGKETILPGTQLPKGEANASEPKAPPRRVGRSASTDSPDGNWTISIKGNNPHLVNRKTNETKALSSEGTASDPFTNRVFWAPDSKTVVVIRRSQGGDRKVTLVESSPKDQLQPKTLQNLYLKPGDPIPQPRPYFFDVAQARQIPVSQELYSNPWDISYERWSSDSKRFYFLYNQRGHQVMRLLAYNTETAKVEPIINEECKTFFDYAHKLYLQYLGDDELLWMSERSGWNHLYRIHAKTGEVLNAVTSGEYVIRRVERFDAAKKQLWLWVMGLNPQEDPYHQHLIRVDTDGKNLTKLTDGDGTHTVNYSPDRSCFIDTYSRVDLPPVRVLRRSSDGQFIAKLTEADDSAWRKTGWQRPERFVAKGRDGQTDIWGVIVRPTNFDPQKKYPVIEYIYAGPQSHFVPKAYRPVHSQLNRMAELGFILVQIDGMGTSWRSKAFHDVCWKNLGDSGFPDRILWIKAAAQKEPAMDLSRVGIFGGSAGGQSSTRAVLAHGDFYKVAVSDCGCHDNRMDKVWWNELWMSWPIGPHYAEQSNVTNAHKLQGKLMLVVGELDTNVDPASTMQVANALIRANKDFELLIMPGVGHGAAETPYASRRRADFFVRHLLNVEPRR